MCTFLVYFSAVGDSLFAEALSCAISVVKANRVQDGATTSCVRREISVSVATVGAFWQNDLLPFGLSVCFGKMICYMYLSYSHI